MNSTTVSIQSALFQNQLDTETTSTVIKTTGHNSLVGSIGETYFDLWCLTHDVCVYAPTAQNARVDRIIGSSIGFLRIHIKTANLCNGGHTFTLWTTNPWRTRMGMDKCKTQSSEADYFVCVGIYENKVPEKMWWLPYDAYKEKRSVALHSGMTELVVPPFGITA